MVVVEPLVPWARREVHQDHGCCALLHICVLRTAEESGTITRGITTVHLKLFQVFGVGSTINSVEDEMSDDIFTSARLSLVLRLRDWLVNVGTCQHFKD